MIHKTLHKLSPEPKSRSPINTSQILSDTKLLFHYSSMNSISINTKQLKQYPSLKVSQISRHISSEEFNKYQQEIYNLSQNHIVESSVGNYQTKLSTNCNSDHQEYQKNGASRRSVEIQLPKVINDLKQTSSTTSAQRIISVKRQIPAFLKTKAKPSIPKKSPNRKFNKDGFIIHKKLGEGKFGKVFLAQQRLSGFLLAMKIVQKRKIIQQNFLDQFIRQLKIQTYLEHSNIIEVYGFFQDDQYFYTLIQLGCDGQLYNLITDKKKLTQQATSFIAKNLLQAIDHMHNLNILHRDIKAQNVVRIMGNVKICDFGWAVNKLTKEQLRSTYCGTPLYLSPEVLKGQKYDQKVDLWAIGVLTYELLLQKSPFEVYQYQDLYKIVQYLQKQMTQQINFPPSKKISKQFQQFITHILNKNPKQRLNSTQLLQMKFIKKYQGFQTCQQLCF